MDKSTKRKSLEILIAPFIVSAIFSCSNEVPIEEKNPQLRNLVYLREFIERNKDYVSSIRQNPEHSFDASLKGEIESDYQNLLYRIKKMKGD